MTDFLQILNQFKKNCKTKDEQKLISYVIEQVKKQSPVADLSDNLTTDLVTSLIQQLNKNVVNTEADNRQNCVDVTVYVVKYFQQKHLPSDSVKEIVSILINEAPISNQKQQSSYVSLLQVCIQYAYQMLDSSEFEIILTNISTMINQNLQKDLSLALEKAFVQLIIYVLSSNNSFTDRALLFAQQCASLSDSSSFPSINPLFFFKVIDLSIKNASLSDQSQTIQQFLQSNPIYQKLLDILITKSIYNAVYQNTAFINHTNESKSIKNIPAQSFLDHFTKFLPYVQLDDYQAEKQFILIEHLSSELQNETQLKYLNDYIIICKVTDEQKIGVLKRIQAVFRQKNFVFREESFTVESALDSKNKSPAEQICLVALLSKFIRRSARIKPSFAFRPLLTPISPTPVLSFNLLYNYKIPLMLSKCTLTSLLYQKSCQTG
ncbi:Hypothetical_protein [Hexamita inflata]|uniref:Hypothetical_protein n=1 Tax=Hexamita inflata TaxID=28002 RepID=A0ABP1HJB5_9EUKA